MDERFIMINDTKVAEYKLVKMMNPESFANKLSVSKLDVGMSLPYGTISCRYSKDDNSESMHVVVVKQKRTNNIEVSARGDNGEVLVQNMNFNFPSLAFIITYNITAKKVTSGYVYMLDPRCEYQEFTPGMNLPCYAFPMPNIGSDHKICIGNTNRDIKSFEEYIETFYSSQWNQDLMDHIYNYSPNVLQERIHQSRGNRRHELYNMIMVINDALTDISIEWIRAGKINIPIHMVDMSGDFTVFTNE